MTVTTGVPQPGVRPAAPLLLGTRRSALARAQSGSVAAALAEHAGRPVELIEVTTYGDVAPEAISMLGGTGVFVSALRDRLHLRDIDLAVHSLKDLPTAPDPALVVAAVPPREDPRDVLVARDGLPLGDLPAGARVGTGSPRRAALLRAARPDLEVVPIRGNVDTRIGKVSTGEIDAVVLARAGLARLGRLDDVTDVLPPETMLPAPGQGALALECRADDPTLRALIGGLDDSATRAAVTAERTLLGELEAGCTAPVGALAEVIGGSLHLRAVVAATDGSRALRMSATGDPASAEETGRRLAAHLLDAGAADLLGDPS